MKRRRQRARVNVEHTLGRRGWVWEAIDMVSGALIDRGRAVGGGFDDDYGEPNPPAVVRKYLKHACDPTEYGLGGRKIKCVIRRRHDR